MPKTISGGWRGFSMAKETAVGTPQTVDTSLNFAGDPMEARPSKIWDNRDENTGEVAPTQHGILTMKTEGKHNQNLMPHNAALFLALLTGTITTTNPNDPNQATVRKHVVATDKSLISLPTRTVREYDGAFCREMAGLACSEVSLSAAVEEFAKIEASLLGVGRETVIDPVPARPAQILEDYLKFGDCVIRVGGTYNGDTVSGGAAISSRVLNWKAVLKNAAALVYEFGLGDDAKYAARVERGNQMMESAVELKLELDTRAEKDQLLACEYFVLEIPLVGQLIGASLTNKFTVRFVAPKVAYNKADLGVDNGKLIINGSLNLFADPTYGPYRIHIINEQPLYL